MLHGWLDEFVVGWLDKTIVLSEDVDDLSSTLADVSLNSSGKTDVIWCQHEDCQVHHLSHATLNKHMDSFEHNDRGCLHSNSGFCSLVECEVICWNFTVLTSS